MLPFLFSEEMNGKRNLILVMLMLAGRLAAYLAVGLLLGAIGAYARNFIEPQTQKLLFRVAAGAAGLLLVLAGLLYNFGSIRLCQFISRFYRTKTSALLLGLFTGLSVCPPFFVAASRVFGTTGALEGMLYFLLFFFGTTVWFLPLFGIHFLNKKQNTLRLVSRMAMLMLGVYFLLVVGIFGLV
jgi:sulfite exporter TauE/SafE